MSRIFNGLEKLSEVWPSSAAMMRERSEHSQEELGEKCRILARELAVTVLENPDIEERILSDGRIVELIALMSRLGDQAAIDQVLAMLPPIIRQRLEPGFASTENS